VTKRLTLAEMADFARALVNRQRSCGSVPAAKTAVILYPEDTDALTQIAAVIEWMAPHADTIRRTIQNG
jgi:hypothetical protein